MGPLVHVMVDAPALACSTIMHGRARLACSSVLLALPPSVFSARRPWTIRHAYRQRLSRPPGLRGGGRRRRPQDHQSDTAFPYHILSIIPVSQGVSCMVAWVLQARMWHVRGGGMLSEHIDVTISRSGKRHGYTAGHEREHRANDPQTIRASRRRPASLHRAPK